MEIMRVHVLVMRIQMMFGEIVSTVGFTGAPKDVELALVHPVLYPVKAHVNGLGTFLADVVMGNAGHSGVVHLNGHGRLCMSKFFQRSTKGACMFGIKEKCTEFSLGCAKEDQLHDLTEDVNRPIVGGWGVL